MNEQQPIEAEVIPTQQAIAVRPQPGAVQTQTVEDLERAFALAVRQRELLSDYIKKQLKDKKHYYEVRGSDKKSLTKEGAEIILLPHGFVPDYEQTAGPTEPPPDNKPYQITVKCSLRRKGDPGSFVGSGIGSAGSHHGYWDKDAKEWSYKPRQPDKYLCHNATLKMAQKSAMIAATINSTAASEFFTQDMGPAEAPGATEPPRPPSRPTPPPAAAPTPKPERLPPSVGALKAKFLENLAKEGLTDNARKFCQEIGWLLPNVEGLEELEPRFIPNSKKQYLDFIHQLTVFSVSGEAKMPYEPNYDTPKEQGQHPSGGTAPTTNSPSTQKTGSPTGESKGWWDEPWAKVIVPIPRKGMKRDEYLKHADTIGSLYDARHDDDDARKRLWGLKKGCEENDWVPKPREFQGKVYQPSDADRKFYRAMKQFDEFFKQNHPTEEL